MSEKQSYKWKEKKVLSVVEIRNHKFDNSLVGGFSRRCADSHLATLEQVPETVAAVVAQR